MSKKKPYRSCEICGIREAHLKEPLFVANFRVDEIRCREWVKVTGNEDLVYLPVEKLHTSKHVCGHHFTKNDFNTKRNRIKKHVIPSININKPLSDDQLSEFPLHLWKPEVAVDKPSTTVLDPQIKGNILGLAVSVAVDEPSTSKAHTDTILSPTNEENTASIAASMDPVTQLSASEGLSDTTMNIQSEKTIDSLLGKVTTPLVTSSASSKLKSEHSYGVKRKIEEKEVYS